MKEEGTPLLEDVYYVKKVAFLIASSQEGIILLEKAIEEKRK